MTDEELLAVYDAAWNAQPEGASIQECERVSLRAVHDAALAAA